MLNGDAVGSGSVVPGWGYGMRLALSRSVRVAPGRVRQESGLGRQSVLALATAWATRSAINLGACATTVQVPLSGDGDIEQELRVEVPSHALAERLVLRTALVLQRAGSDAASPLAAVEPGSVLWADSATLILEQHGARMPILSADFSQFQTTERGAAWYVWTGPDWLHRHPTDGVVVYVNAARNGLLAALSTRVPDSRSSALQSMFFHDVGRVLIDRALTDEEFRDDADFAAGSAGASLRATLRAIFRQQTLSQVRRSRSEDAAAFERILQTRHGLLDVLA